MAKTKTVQPKVDQDKMTGSLAPQKLTAQQKEQERLEQEKKRQEEEKAAKLAQNQDNKTTKVPPPPPTKVVSTFAGNPVDQEQDGKVDLKTFKSIVATSDDVNSVFQKYLKAGRLVKPRAIAIEMRRLGHYIEYNEK